MEFIDHTGHIFSIKSYIDRPIGYQYDIQPYVFWLGTEYTKDLSVGNFYMLPIRMVVLGSAKIEELSIAIEDSNIFSLYSSSKLHKKVDDLKSLNSYIEINENDFTKSLSLNDLQIYNTGTDQVIPFYVMGNSPEEGSIMTNALIYLKLEGQEAIWTPITIGGVFKDEEEFLIVDGQNLGVKLPKEILKAIYQYSYKNEEKDEVLYSKKLKEYLLAFMHIRGQVGNYLSVLDSLKWFGYGEHLEIQKLFQTDNQFMDQFFLDDFSISDNVWHSFQMFRASTYISLRLWENRETGDSLPHEPSYDQVFWGEGNPELENLFDKTIVNHYDEGDLDFVRSFYDYMFDEMGLKLAMLDYYFKKYFLPLHLHIHSTSITHRVYANDIKLINSSNVHVHQGIVDLTDDLHVKFNDVKFYYIYNQEHYTDIYFNEFSSSKDLGLNSSNEVIYMNEPCVRIPIRFTKEGYHQCHLILMKDSNKVYESDFKFIQTESNKYLAFIILPSYINRENDKEQNYWLDSKYTLAILCDDVWYYHKFQIKMPEMQLNFGTLEYRYYANGLDDFQAIDLWGLYEKHKDKLVPLTERINALQKELDELSEDIPNYAWTYSQINMQLTTARMQRQAICPQLHDYGFWKDRDRWAVGYDYEGRVNDPIDLDTRYVMDSNNITYHTQLHALTDDEIDFNVFMYVPSLVEVNDIQFYDKLRNIIYNVNGSVTEGTSSSVQTGIMTKNRLLKMTKEKSSPRQFTRMVGKEYVMFDDRILVTGEHIVPAFYFNDFTRDQNGDHINGAYHIEQYYVDVYFGFYTNDSGVTDYFAKKQIHLYIDGEPNDEWLYSTSKHPYGLVDNILIDWDDWSEDYKRMAIVKYGEHEDPIEFQVDELIKSKRLKNLTLRFVWSMKLQEEDEFISSYDVNGFPKQGFYKDIIIPLEGQSECTCSDGCLIMRFPTQLKCKYKTIVDKNYIDVPLDYVNDKDKESFTFDLVNQESDALMESLITDLLNDSQQSINIVTNDDYMNRIHIYNIYHNGYVGKIDPLTDIDIYADKDDPELYKRLFRNQSPNNIVPILYDKETFGDYRTTEEEWNKHWDSVKRNLIDLYSLFFEKDTANQLVNWYTKSDFNYDFYLMHDDKYWYVVFISQMPKSMANRLSDLDPLEFVGKNQYIDIHGHGFEFRPYRSGDNFLINRMYFRSAEGNNTFYKKQIIAATIDNVEFPIVLDKGSKWDIVPVSLGIDKENYTSSSNTNSCLMTIGTKSVNYANGYYDVNVRYSIDGNIQHQQFTKGRIKIV